MKWVTSLLLKVAPNLLPGLGALLNPWVLLIVGLVWCAGIGTGVYVQDVRWDASLKNIAEREAADLRRFLERQGVIVAAVSGDLNKARAELDQAHNQLAEALARVDNQQLFEVECPADHPARHVALGGDAGIGLKLPKKAGVDVPPVQGAPAVRLSDTYRRLWNAGLSLAVPEPDRARWLDGANARSGSVGAIDTLRNGQINAALLGQCRAREAGWQAFARENGLTGAR